MSDSINLCSNKLFFIGCQPCLVHILNKWMDIHTYCLKMVDVFFKLRLTVWIHDFIPYIHSMLLSIKFDALLGLRTNIFWNIEHTKQMKWWWEYNFHGIHHRKFLICRHDLEKHLFGCEQLLQLLKCLYELFLPFMFQVGNRKSQLRWHNTDDLI